MSSLFLPRVLSWAPMEFLIEQTDSGGEFELAKELKATINSSAVHWYWYLPPDIRPFPCLATVLAWQPNLII